MNRIFLRSMVALALAVGLTGLAQAATPGVHDPANMFSADACKQADEKLAAVHKTTGWEIVIETIETLGGKPVDRLTADKAVSLRVKGVYFLMAKKEGKVHFWINRPAAQVFDKEDVSKATEKLISDFKSKQFDQGLLELVDSLSQIARDRSHSGAKQTGPARPGSPAPTAQHDAPPEAGGSWSFLKTVLIIGAVIVGVLLLVRLFAGSARPGGMGGPGGYGGPGYGGGGGGGGFFSSLMGGLGGALLGNWLSNSLFGNQARASEPFRGSSSDPSAPGGFDDQGVSGGGEWGDSSGESGADGGGGDTGGSDDAGGFDGGGDSGGGDFGGGDFGGGGDSGGGDW